MQKVCRNKWCKYLRGYWKYISELGCKTLCSWWLQHVSTPLKNIRQIGSCPKVGVKKYLKIVKPPAKGCLPFLWNDFEMCVNIEWLCKPGLCVYTALISVHPSLGSNWGGSTPLNFSPRDQENITKLTCLEADIYGATTTRWSDIMTQAHKPWLGAKCKTRLATKSGIRDVDLRMCSKTGGR